MKNWQIDEIKIKLTNTNWELLNDVDANEAYNTFETKLFDTLNEVAPEKNRTIKAQNIIKEPWMATGLLVSSKRLNETLKKFIRHNKNHESYKKYIVERNKLNSLKRKAKFN